MNFRTRGRDLRAAALPFVLASVLSGLPGSPVLANDDLVIIANPAIRDDSVGQKELQRIYLGKHTQWEDKTSIVPVMLKSGPLHDEFIEAYLDRSVQRFVTYWRQMVFTGKGVPPRNFTSERELVEFVASTPGSVGYVSSKTPLAGVKILPVE